MDYTILLLLPVFINLLYDFSITNYCISTSKYIHLNY